MNFLLIFLMTIFVPAFASQSTEISCEMKRNEQEKMTFEIRFLTPKRAVAILQTQSTSKRIPVTAIHQSVEARYVGLNFVDDEKLVFILLMPIFEPENAGIPFSIEVVSSIQGPSYVQCRATK